MMQAIFTIEPAGSSVRRNSRIHLDPLAETPRDERNPVNLEKLEKHRIDLALPVLLLRSTHGLLACGYFNVDTFNKTGEACAIVTGVADYDQMLTATVVSVSAAALEKGVEVGDTGETALRKMESSVTD